MSATVEAPAVFRSSARRPNAIGLVAEGAREVWSRRLLIRYLVRAEFKKKGADTVLGNVWWVLDPLLQMAIYAVLVSVIFARPQPDYPLFIFAAILPWKWFTSSIQDGTVSVTRQEQLIKQVKFPKLVLPAAVTTAEVASFGFGLIALAGLLVLFYADRISPYLLLLPVIAAVQYVFTLACTIGVAAVNVFFRDIGNVARHVLRLWFYLSPGLYSIEALERSSLPSWVGWLLQANPFAVLFEAYRAVIYGTAEGGPRPPEWAALGLLLIVSLVLLALATAFFKRLEPSFAKVL